MKIAILALTLFSTSAMAQEAVGAWNFEVVTDPMSDATRGIAHTSRDDQVFMVLKCDENGDNSLYFSFIAKQYLGSVRSAFRPVRYRIDGSPPRDIRAFYEDSTANVINVEPGNDGGKFLRELAGATELTVEVTDYRGNPHTAVIDVTGAAQAIDKVATACKDTVNSSPS